jgi:membrane-associated phospholipid phosphatase
VRGANNILIVANKILTGVGYIAYPLLLVCLFFMQPEKLVPCVAVPGVSFVLVSLFRRAVNAPRPYEVTGTPPLIPKSTQGKSFPSRHTFCMFMIAASWLNLCAAAGVALMISGCAMAAIRVVGGVHWPRDVIAGAACALVLATIGYAVIPW